MNPQKAKAMLELAELLNILPENVSKGFLENFLDKTDYVEFKIEFRINIPKKKAKKVGK